MRSRMGTKYLKARVGAFFFLTAFVACEKYDCGKISSIGKPLVINGESAKSAEVPWHAAVYTKTTRPYKQICGGTLISNKIVLSAAHCFWNDSGSKQLPAADFAVAVGKLYRPWSDDKDDAHAQRSNVTALHLPPLFQGSAANFQEDLAVVVATITFKVTTFVRPVCVDFDFMNQNKHLTVGNMGKVAGWGFTAVNGPPSQVLKVVELPFVSGETCKNESPPEFRGHITSDKFCAGFRNEHKGVCKGDSGGGIAFHEYDKKGTARFYLQGIVSTAPTSNELCNVNFYTTFTQIQRHEHFIKQFWENRELFCKEESFGSYDFTPLYSMDNETLKHVTVKRDSAGLLTYFEMHVSIQADEFVEIRLWNEGSVELVADIKFTIYFGGYQDAFTTLYHQNLIVQRIGTRAILSPTQFRTFYVKVDDGELLCGREGDDVPLISYRDPSIRSVKYFGFGYGGLETAKIRYDCPAPVLGDS